MTKRRTAADAGTAPSTNPAAGTGPTASAAIPAAPAAGGAHDPFPRGFWPLWPKIQWLIRRRREFLKRHRKAIIWGQVGFVVVAVLIMIAGMHVFAPDLKKFEQRSPVLFDAQGNVLYSAMTQDDYHRIYTTVDDVDPLYLKMLLAAEDERFYHHWGVDSFAIVRAMMQNLQTGQVVSGASTITMQVCRLLEPKERNIFNKVKEALGALNLTYYQGREAVLNMYLTLAPFGGNIEGVTAASYMYFGHSPKHLTPDEAALLVALPRAPEGMRPDHHPKIARYYRHQVLAKAYEEQIIAQDVMELADQEPLPRQRLPLPHPAYHLGQSLFLGKLQPPERARLYPVSSVALVAADTDPALGTNGSANSSNNTALGTNSTSQSPDAYSAHPSAAAAAPSSANEIPHIPHHLRGGGTNGSANSTNNTNQSPDAYSARPLASAAAPSAASTNSSSTDAAHATARFVLERQQPSELYSTIDPRIQQSLNQIAQDYIESLPPSAQEAKQESIALIAVDNRNFTVLGYVGSPFIKLSYVDAVQALRSPGSALKPFAYAMAFAQNLLHPHSLLLDTAHLYGSYQPRNYTRRFYGEITAAQALQASLNLPAIEIMKAIGPTNFINNLNQFTNAQDLSDHSGELDSYNHGRLHLAANTKPHLGLVLGAGEISLYDLTQLYAALAHDGKITPLTLLRRPQDHSRDLEVVNRTITGTQVNSGYTSSSIKANNSSANHNASNANDTSHESNDFYDSDVPRLNPNGTDVPRLDSDVPRIDTDVPRLDMTNTSNGDSGITSAARTALSESQHLRGSTNSSAKANTEHNTANASANDITFGPFLPEDAARATYLILNDTPAPDGYQQDQMQISYKTGTSHKYRDTVALGSSGGLTIGIWTGRLDGKPRRAYSAFEIVAPLLFKTFATLPAVPRIPTSLPPSPLLSATPPVALTRVSTLDLGKVQKRVINPSLNAIPLLGQLNADDSQTSANRGHSHSDRLGNTSNGPDSDNSMLINEDDFNPSSWPDSYDSYDSHNNADDFTPAPMPAINNPLQLNFPQNDAHLQVGMSGQIMVNFSGGQVPYYVLVNDQLQDHSDYFCPQYNGIHFITVIDSLGNSVSSQVYIQGVLEPASEDSKDNENNESLEASAEPAASR